LTVNGYLGIQLLDAYQDEPTSPPPTDDYRRSHTTDLGGTGGLSFSYRLKTGSITGGIGYGLTPEIVALAAQAGMTMADLAHRYALTMDGVDAVILGVKNRQELAECLAAEAAGPLRAELIRAIDECPRSA
jgi:hypothetical protein